MPWKEPRGLKNPEACSNMDTFEFERQELDRSEYENVCRDITEREDENREVND